MLVSSIADVGYNVVTVEVTGMLRRVVGSPLLITAIIIVNPARFRVPRNVITVMVFTRLSFNFKLS